MQFRKDMPSAATRLRCLACTSQYGSPGIEQARCSSEKTKSTFGGLRRAVGSSPVCDRSVLEEGMRTRHRKTMGPLSCSSSVQNERPPRRVGLSFCRVPDDDLLSHG